jgi:hypothetical protein
VDVLDLGVAVLRAVEWWQLNAPLEELLNLDVEASIGVLVGNDAINGGVGETSLVGNVLLSLIRELGLDEASESVGGTDHVLAGNNSQWVVKLAGLNALGDDWGNELEDVGSDGAGDSVGSGNLLDHLVLLVLAVDGTIVVDGEGALTVIADFSDGVRSVLLQGLDDRVHDIDEDNLIAGVVQELGYETTGMISAAVYVGEGQLKTNRPMLPPPKWMAFLS